MHARLDEDVFQTLSQGAWFAGLGDELQGALLRNGKVVRADRGQGPDRQFALQGSLCAVARGAVKLVRRLPSGRELAIGFIEPGMWIGGEAGLDDPGVSGAGYEAEARGEFVLLVVEAPELRQLARRYPELVTALLRLQSRLAQRLADMLEEINEMPLGDRVARRLSALGRAFAVPDKTGGARRIGIRVSQQDLADLTGASRQRVNVEIKQLERRGLLRMVCGHLELQPALNNWHMPVAIAPVTASMAAM